VEAGIGASESLLDRFNSKPVISDGVLAEPLIDQCREAVQCTEFPRAQRFGSRPPLARIFVSVASRADRNARAVAAVRDHGYAMREVADFLGVHYITVSRALARADGLRARSEMSECKT
jgi:DNA-directed RNA polymerase specialized sigma24 family protein